MIALIYLNYRRKDPALSVHASGLTQNTFLKLYHRYFELLKKMGIFGSIFDEDACGTLRIPKI